MSIEDIHQEANNLRQGKKYKEAIPLYEKAWAEAGDQYDGAGLLQCLRKSGDIEKAIPLAEELVEKYPDFSWVKNEAIWTLISGQLNKLHEDASLKVIVVGAQRSLFRR